MVPIKIYLSIGVHISITIFPEVSQHLVMYPLFYISLKSNQIQFFKMNPLDKDHHKQKYKKLKKKLKYVNTKTVATTNF